MIGLDRVVALGLALAAAGCCCPAETRTRPPREPSGPIVPASATLSVSSVPDADVWVDGVPWGRSPRSGPLPAGPHTVEVRLGGYEDGVVPVHLAPGGSRRVAVVLVARDVEDPEVLQALARPLRLWVQSFDRPEDLRGDAEAPPVHALYPRGAVRPADLDRVAIEFDQEGEAAGAIEFRRGATVLHREEITAPARGVVVRPVPEAVRAALATGDRVSWGFVPRSGAPAVAEFEVVGKEVQGLLDAVEKDLAGQPSAARAHLRAQILLDAGLPYAAEEEARRIVESGEAGVRTWAVVLEAFEKMGVPTTSRAWREARERVGGFPPAEQERVYPSAETALRRLVEHVESGQAGRALQGLDAARIESLSRDAPAVHALAASAAGNARRLVAVAPGSAARLADAIGDLARRTKAAAPQDSDAGWAVGYALLLRARTAAATGEKPVLGRWVEAADAVLESLGGGPHAPEAAAWAVGVLHEAARLPWADRASLTARAKSLLDDARARHPDSARVAEAAAFDLLAQARSTLVGGNSRDRRAEARQRLSDALEALQPHLATETPDLGVATRWNEAVTFARSHDLGGSLEYRAPEHASLENLLTVRVPLSRRWQVREDPRARRILVVDQRDEDGALLRRVTATAFAWGLPYRFVNGQDVGGENLGQLAENDLDDARREFKKVRNATKSRRLEFTKRFPKAYGWRVAGMARDGGYLAVWARFFKSEEHDVTYEVRVEELQELPDRDPELEFVLESLRDVKTP